MDTGRIEREAVRAVSGYIDSCPRLASYIQNNDRSPLVDGSIYIYKVADHNGNNNNIHSSVPVQVKGRTTIKVTKEGISFNEINRDGLYFYMRNGGCIFFLVRFINNDFETTEIYYRLLDIVFLDKILKNTTAEQPTFHLDPVPEKGEFTTLLIEFSEKRYMAFLTLLKNGAERAKEDPEIIKTDKNFSEDLLSTLHKLSELHNIPNRHKEAEELYIKTLSTYRELAKTNLEYLKFVAMILNNLAIIHRTNQKFANAEKEYKDALNIYRELAKTNRDAYIGYVATTLNNLAGLYWKLNRLEDAIKELKDALKIFCELARTNRNAYISYVARVLYNIALLQEATDRKVEAKESAKEALGIYKELAKSYPQIWNSKVKKTEQLLEILSE